MLSVRGTLLVYVHHLLCTTINYSSSVGEDDQPEPFAAKLSRVISILILSEISRDRSCSAKGRCELCSWVA